MRFPTVILILHIFEKGPMYLLKRLIYCRLTGGTRLANFSFPSGRRKPQMPCGDKIWTRILSRVGSEEGTGTRDYLPPLHTGDTRHASVFLSKLDFSPPPNNICAFFSWGFVSFQSVFLARTGVLVCLEGPPTLGVRTSAFGKEELYYLWAAHIFVHSFNSGSCFTSSWWKRLSIRVRGAPGGGWQGHQQQPS